MMENIGYFHPFVQFGDNGQQSLSLSNLPATLIISTKLRTDPTLARHKRRKIDRLPEPKQESIPAIKSSSPPKPMCIEETGKELPSTNSIPEVTITESERKIDNLGELNDPLATPKLTRGHSTRNQSKLDKRNNGSSHPGTTAKKPTKHTINEQASKKARSSTGNSTKGNHTKAQTSSSANTKSPFSAKEELSQRPVSKQIPSTRTIPSVQLNSSKILTESDVVHDEGSMMFKVVLDDKGCIAAICYLPTRFRGVLEFYHTEIPIEYRSLGIGDLLASCAFQWADNNGLNVLPTCPFLQRHLKQRFPNEQERWTCVVENEKEALNRMIARKQRPIVFPQSTTL